MPGDVIKNLTLGVESMNSLKFFIVTCAIVGASTSVYADDSLMVATSSTATASSMVVPSSSVAVASSASATAPQSSRFRLFGQNGFGMAFYPKSKCEGGPNKITVSGGLGAMFSSLFGTVKNESIGMPETETTKNLAKRNGLLSKAYFREYQIEAGEPVAVAASFSDPSGARCRIAVTFVPESGVDYESRLDLSGNTCTLIMNRVGQDGSLTSVPIVRADSCK